MSDTQPNAAAEQHRTDFWTERARELATVVPVMLAFVVLRELDVFADVEAWVYLVALWGAYAISLLASAFFRDRLWARTLLVVLATTVPIYATGLGPMLAVGYVVIAVDQIRSVGARAALPVFVWSLLGLTLGQVAIELDLAPSVVSETRAHGLAVLAGLAIAPTMLLFASVAGARERSEQTASRLLDLAHVLSQPGTRREVSQRLADAVPHVLGLQRSIVLLWDGEELHTAGLHGYGSPFDAELRALAVSPGDVPTLAELLERPAIIQLSADTDDAFVRATFERYGAVETFVAPMTAASTLVGYIVVDRAEGRATGLSVTLRQRLRGLADQAAVALDNARLIEQERDVIEQLREADRLKSEFLAIVSHELRTPLSVMMGAARTLQWRSDELDRSTREDLVESVVRRGEQLNRLVEDLLQASGELKLDLTSVDLASVARTAVADAAGLHPEAEMHCAVPDERILVRADAFRMRQVVDNLLQNATKYADGGRVDVEVGWVGDDACVCVADTGPGMTPEVAAHAFDAFYQGDSSAVRKVGGLGLGLHICRRIVEAHGGLIWAESQPGRGTRIKFTLPAAGPVS